MYIQFLRVQRTLYKLYPFIPIGINDVQFYTADKLTEVKPF